MMHHRSGLGRTVGRWSWEGLVMPLVRSEACIVVLALATSVVSADRSWAADASTLVWAEAAEPSTVDPAKSNVNQEMTIARNVFDHLVNFDLEHPDQLLPALATTWKQDG